ncbi:MAG: pyridoxamine 5'-phosphate oxidase [Alcaligenaceae bacterium]|nr:pyridoxamine 5'-phosphate oxidase [Alcaligenaceae bacterium]
MTPTELETSFKQLMAQQRTGSLATITNQGLPYVSMAPFAIDRESAQFIIHISELAAHTRYLMQRPQASFMVCASEVPGEPVRGLPRVSYQVEATDLARGTPAWEAAEKHYLERFPNSAPILTELKDFHLFALKIVRARQVAGFGAAKTLALPDIQRWLQEPFAP